MNLKLDREWLMLAGAALAGGAKARDAISAADQVCETFENRHEEEREKA